MPVAVAGIGKMGKPIAERLLAAGHPLYIWNRTPEKTERLARQGANVLGSPREALQATEVCVTMLADDAALDAVVLGKDGLLAGARPGSVLVDMSTVSVAASTRVADGAARAQVEYLRCPVSGNPVVVRGGNLTLIASGPERAARRLEPLLHAIGPKLFYVGDGERARVVKLVLQVLIGGTAELLAEALALGEAAGVDRAKLLRVIRASAAGSPFVAYKSGPLVRDDYSATFTTAMMLKDAELVLELAQENGAELPFAQRLARLLESAVDRGYADLDFTSLFLQLRDVPPPQPTTSSR